MTHTPVLTVVNETDSPRLWIIQRCMDCNVTVSRREIDVSRLTVPEDYGWRQAEGDAAAWLKHISEGNA